MPKCEPNPLHPQPIFAINKLYSRCIDRFGQSLDICRP